MITPEYLEQAADQIEKIYTDFQEWAIRDIVNRLLETDFEVSGTTQWRAEKVQQAGLVYNDLTARIAKETGKSQTEIKRLFRDAGVEVYNYGDEVYQGLGIQPLSVRQSPAMLNVLMAGMKKTEKTMKNLTGTTASMAQSQFISACDGAWMAVSSGAVSYNEAVINAVGQVGSSGMWIRYPETGHRDRLDVATRRCVLSGLGRTVGTLNEMACDELDCDLVEVTAHWNARPSHAEWQGLVYSRSGKNKNYPDFSVCGYGTGAGLLGWNCYHDFHPFFEGISERLYTEKQLAEMKNDTVKYNGKEIGGYEATQVQRGIERKIRESKRKLIAYDEGIKNSSGTLRDDFRMRYSVESKQLSELNKRLDDFCSQTGFVKQYDRSRVQGFGRSQAQKAVQAGKKSLTGGGKSGNELRYNRISVVRKDNGLTNGDAGGIINLNRSFLRKERNIGAFSDLQIPLQKRKVLDICKKYGIETRGLTFKIQRNEKLLSIPYYGSTDYNNIGRIDLFPNAFINEEQMVKTILHEKCHVLQLKKYGKEYTQNKIYTMETQAERFESLYYNIVKKKVK